MLILLANSSGSLEIEDFASPGIPSCPDPGGSAGGGNSPTVSNATHPPITVHQGIDLEEVGKPIIATEKAVILAEELARLKKEVEELKKQV